MRLICGDGAIEFKQDGEYRRVPARTEFECPDNLALTLIDIGSAFPVLEDEPTDDDAPDDEPGDEE